MGSMSMRVQSQALLSGLSMAASFCSDQVFLWLWRKHAAAAPRQLLAGNLNMLQVWLLKKKEKKKTLKRLPSSPDDVGCGEVVVDEPTLPC